MEKQNPGIWIGAAIALAVLIVAISVPGDPKKPAPPTPAATAQPSSSAQPGSVAKTTPAAGTTTNPTTPPATAALSPAKPAPTPPRDPDDPPPVEKPPLPPATLKNVRQAMDDIDLVIRDFRAALGGNPVGDNAEITAALLGSNLKQLKLRLPDTSPVNAAGELCDMWGTPYFFHQLSGKQMEIRSAGPDRKMWTGDDVRH